MLELKWIGKAIGAIDAVVDTQSAWYCFQIIDVESGKRQLKWGLALEVGKFF